MAQFREFFSKSQNNDSGVINWIDVGWAAFLSALFIFYFFADGPIWLFNLIIVPVVLAGYANYRRLSEFQRKFLTGLMLAVVITYSFRIAWSAYRHVLDPPGFDFHLYWVYGQVSARLLNPYEQSYLLQAVEPLNPPEILLNELYFFYLPPSIFLFIPLGWFGLHSAALLWYIFLIVVLIGIVFLLWNIFIEPRDFTGLFLVAVLLVMLEGALLTLDVAQINFLVLLTFLLFWRRHETFTGGAWLGVGSILKPILVIVFIYPVLRRHWRALVGAAAAFLVLSILTIAVFGPNMFFGYFFTNPIAQSTPDYLYTEDTNQSLLATTLRLTGYDFSGPSMYLQPVFFIAAALITGITFLLVYRRKNEQPYFSDWALALTLAYALLIFPSTHQHYSVHLIVPVVMVWVNRRQLSVSGWLVIAIITAVYVLVSLKGHFVFGAFLITWLGMAGICARFFFDSLSAKKERLPAGEQP
jgi:hypothetical protein